MKKILGYDYLHRVRLPYTYFQSLDSTRYSNSDSQENQEVFAENEILLSFLFGMGLTVSDNQMGDSYGFIKTISQIADAEECIKNKKVYIPFRVAVRNKNLDPFDQVAKNFYKEDYILSAFPSITQDISLRKQWADSIRNHEIYPFAYQSPDAEILVKLLGALHYVNSSDDKNRKIRAFEFPHMLKKEVDQILSIKEFPSIEDFFEDSRKTVNSIVIQPAWFDSIINKEATLETQKLIDALYVVEKDITHKKDIEKLKEPKADQKLRSRTLYYQTINAIYPIDNNAGLHNGLKALIDYLYNYVTSYGSYATSFSMAAVRDLEDKYQLAAYVLAEWSRETIKTKTKIYRLEDSNGWMSSLKIGYSEQPDIPAEFGRIADWEEVFMMFDDPKWVASIKLINSSVNEVKKRYQELIFDPNNKFLQQKYIDSKSAASECWWKHFYFLENEIFRFHWNSQISEKVATLERKVGTVAIIVSIVSLIIKEALSQGATLLEHGTEVVKEYGNHKFIDLFNKLIILPLYKRHLICQNRSITSSLANPVKPAEILDA